VLGPRLRHRRRGGRGALRRGGRARPRHRGRGARGAPGAAGRPDRARPARRLPARRRDGAGAQAVGAGPRRAGRGLGRRDAPPGGVVAAARVVVGLGANLGDPLAALRAAVVAMDELDGVEVLAVSPVYRTAPQGGPEQPDYLNAAALLAVALEPL